MTADAAGSDRCPRCGGGFHCGASDALPCACRTLPLDADLLAALRQRYTGCLCLRCLGELAQAGTAGPDAVAMAPIDATRH